MSSPPLVSILIPTRNRASLLHHALASACHQSWEDIEIVVSDNRSDDGTADVVAQFNDSRIRFVRTSAVLPMPDHWEFIVNHARGDLMTLLCDDDALDPTTVESAVVAARSSGLPMVTWNAGWYFHPSWPDEKLQNALVLKGPFGGSAIVLDAREDLSAMFRCAYHIRHPKAQNTLWSRDFLEEIRTKMGRVFLPPCPDYSFGAAALALCDRYVFVDRPLYLAGSAPESIGASAIYRVGEAMGRYIREFGGEDVLARVPLKSMLSTNYASASILFVKEKLADHMEDVSFDWTAYWLACGHQLGTLRKRGVDCSEEWREFYAVLAGQDLAREELVRSVMIQEEDEPAMGSSGWLQRRTRDAALVRHPRTMLKRMLARMRGVPAIQEWPKTFEGKRWGFSNILECSQQLDALCGSVSERG